MPMTSEKLEKLERELVTQAEFNAQNEQYARGNNPFILNRPGIKKPDNRIPNPLAKVAVESMAGYAGGKGAKQVLYDKADTEGKDENDPFIEYCTQMDEFNDADIENSELYEESLTQGEAYEIFWTSDDLGLQDGLLTTEYKIVPNHEVLLKYNNNLKKDLEFAIHFTISLDEDLKERQEATIYYPLKHELWVKEEAVGKWRQEELENPDYPFKDVPVNTFPSNRRNMPLFQAEKPLIDSYDEVLSKSLNEVDRFNQVIMLLGQGIDKKFADAIKAGDVSIIDNLANESGSALAEYLEKNLGGVESFFNNLLDRFNDDFHKSVGVINWSDDVFSGSQSGLAMLIRLTVMEFKASTIDTYFDQGINRRLGFYADVYNASTKSVEVGEYTTIIKSKRNVPVDETATAEMLNLIGERISDKTYLEKLGKGIVTDVDKELARLKEERAKTPFLNEED